MKQFRNWLVLGTASLIGYVVGVVTLIVWAGYRLYEGAFGDDRD